MIGVQNIWESIVLGIIQGLTEFLPVSSSAHLILVPWLLGWQDGGLTFDVALHLGTLCAVLIYFRKDWLELTKNFFTYGVKGKTTEQKMPIYIILATIPGALLGLILEKKIETDFRNPFTIAITLAVMGCALWYADKTSKKSKDMDHIKLKEAVIIGTAQAIALFPGVSRSGITILTGLFLGLNRPTAAKFSFLLAMPITFGACVLKLRYLTSADLTPSFCAGVLSSAIFGYLAIDGLIKFLQRRSYGVFAVYRVAVGILVVLLVILRK